MVSVPRLSILVPHAPAAGVPEPAFEDTLASILQYRPGDCEILVSHAGEYEDPYDLRGEVRFLEQPLEATLLELLNAGIDRVRGELLHILLPGHRVSDGWVESALELFRDERVGSVAPVVVSEQNPELAQSCGVSYGIGGARRLSGAGLSLRTIAERTPAIYGPTLAAGFYRTDVVCSLLGFAREVGEILSDIDLALSLEHLGYRAAVAPSSLVFATLPAAREVPSYQAGLHAERLFRRHASQLGVVGSFLAHPLAVTLRALGDIPHPGALTQLIGRMAAWFDGSSVKSYRELLSEAREEIELESQATLSMADAPRNNSKASSDDSRRRAA